MSRILLCPNCQVFQNGSGILCNEFITLMNVSLLPETREWQGKCFHPIGTILVIWEQDE